MVQVISELKEDIINIKYENAKIIQNIGALEKEFDECIIEDSLSDKEEEFKECTEKEPILHKCKKCEFECEMEMALKKHRNTKHSKEELNEITNEYEHIVTENDMFQMEIVEGETGFACNICDEGFDFIDEVNRHISEAASQTMTIIELYLCKVK